MALTPAQKQKRYREKRKAMDQMNPDAIERELLHEVERCDRGEMSDQERFALAHKLADLAMNFFWRSKKLADIAGRVRTGSDRPLQR
jgi:hypothetical protein